MLKALSNFFQQFESTPHSAAEIAELRVAIACLVQEARRVDEDHDAREHPAAIAALVRMFGIEQGEAETLLEQAREKARQLTSYYPLVSVIKRDLSLEERILLIEVLWRVAYADGALHGHEDHFVRKIAHLLYVPNTQVMLARGRARG
ncbi:MAG TPA: TerB family tellurite resistance protein [Burkholderiales bacterium]|nr:TerB family tellurite resistance protein [Burkholderiales bacterium]